ncbi:MAG: HAD-IIA family hydrolase [Anaerolineales bacterium]|nr:HAD-IIA family hydrolase [Anaerolineales bacterium]
MPYLERLARARCFLLDMDGTFYLGDRLIDGAGRMLEVLRARGQDFIFLTNNSSKNARLYSEKLTRLGLPTAAGQVLTSGAATAAHLQAAYAGARVFVVGTPALEEEFTSRGFELDAAAPDLVVLGFDTGLTYAKLWTLCDHVRAGRPYFATHPDFTCVTDTGYMPDIGATIAFVRAAAGRDPDLIAGKPNRIIAEQAAARLGVPVAALCMIGDQLDTDIALGAAAGIPTLLVLSGEAGLEHVAEAPHPPDFIFPHIGAVADYLAALPPAAE